MLRQPGRRKAAHVPNDYTTPPDGSGYAGPPSGGSWPFDTGSASAQPAPEHPAPAQTYPGQPYPGQPYPPGQQPGGWPYPDAQVPPGQQQPGGWPYPDAQVPTGQQQPGQWLHPDAQVPQIYGYPAGPYPAAPYLGNPYAVYPAPAQSNGLATAALVTGILGFMCAVILPFVAIGLGIGGLNQSKRTGVGRGMSIAGICLGIGWLLLVGVWLALVLTLGNGSY